MIPSDVTDADRQTCLAVLRRLAECPDAFLDKAGGDFAKLCEVRAAANRLIEAIKGSVRVRRGQPARAGKGRSAAPADGPRVMTAPLAAAEAQTIPCYVCGSIGPRHPEYSQLCQECGRLHVRKRRQRVDLSGRVAIVTGGRVGIGFRAARRLLDLGATVHVTTRFPVSAAEFYSREPDFDAWRERLRIHSLDFRETPAVAMFAASLATEGPLDILINNAAQTVRRPAAAYAALVDRELRGPGLPAEVRGLLACQEYHGTHGTPGPALGSSAALARNVAGASLMSQWKILPEDELPYDSSHVPDERGELPDLRTEHSWTRPIDGIHPVEFAEVYRINAFAPFLLLQQLLPAMRRSAHSRRFVVNVSAREGRFSVDKGHEHPHTNMAKAAVNMLTRTVADELSREGIFVTSVDPGWVSNQQPSPGRTNAWPPPLTAEDGAARLLDPILRGLAETGPPLYGVLLKDFEAVDW